MAKPLTKRDKNGDVYRRRPQVEAAIDPAVAMSLQDLQAAAKLPRGAIGHLENEVLLHLVRLARDRRDEITLTQLVPLLLGRCELLLRGCLPAACDQTHLREEVLSRFSEMLAYASDRPEAERLDFFEANFERAFRSLRISATRWEAGRMAPQVSTPEDADGEPRPAQALRVNGVPAALADVLTMDAVRALDRLPPADREAWVLVHLVGLKEESTNPDEDTAAKRLNVTGRTVRNRLTRAEACLATLEEK